MTEHDTLSELFGLLGETEVWPKRITKNYTGWEYRSDLFLDDEENKPSPTFHILEPADALAIVTQRVEGWLFKEGWFKRWQDKTGVEWNQFEEHAEAILDITAAVRHQLAKEVGNG